jgi:nitrite reductase (NADH) small subunit
MTAARVPSETHACTWIEVCTIDDLELDRGVCALVESRQIALFRLTAESELYAVSNYDPCSDASVLSRGIVGSAGTTLTIASPVYKHRFDLRTGQCLDDPSISIPVYPVETFEGRVFVGLP